MLRETLSNAWWKSWALFAHLRGAGALASAVLMMLGLLEHYNFWLILGPPCVFMLSFFWSLAVAAVQIYRRKLQEAEDLARQLSSELEREKRKNEAVESERCHKIGDLLIDLQQRTNTVRALPWNSYQGTIRATEEEKSLNLICKVALTLKQYFGLGMCSRFIAAEIVPLSALAEGEHPNVNLDYLRSHVRYLEGHRNELRTIISTIILQRSA